MPLIVDIGQNYVNNLGLAKRLILLSKKAGAELTKFQLFDYEKLYPQHQIPKVELTYEQAKELFDYGKSIKQEVFFSVFDLERVEWCEKIGVKFYKIPARMRDLEVLRAIEKTYKNVFISVDPSLKNEIELDGTKLYCVSQYPATVSLRFVDFNKEWDGLSDHSEGSDISIIALSRGARFIERHFAIDHKTGVDARWSLTYNELLLLKQWENVVKETLK